jgi:putative transposase
LSQAGHQRAYLLSLEKKFAGLGRAELRRLRQLEEENHNRKQLVADLTLDTPMVQEVVRKTLYRQRRNVTQSRYCRLASPSVNDEHVQSSV